MTSFRAATALAVLTLLAAPAAYGQSAQFPAEDPHASLSPEAAKQEAARRFEHAIKLYEDADYALALAEFERVHELMPDYRVLYNIGQVNIQLGRYARAFRALKEYATRGGKDLPPDRQKSVQADLELLAGRVATVSVSVDQAGAELSLDGAVVGTSPLAEPLIVDVGERILQVRLAGYLPQNQSLTLAGGDRRSAQFVLQREPTTTALTPTLPQPAPPRNAPAVPRVATQAHAAPSRAWLGWTATGALATGALVAGGLGASAASKLETLRATAGVSRADLDRAHSQAATRLLVADVLAAAAVVSGGVTLYFQLSGSKSKSDAGAAPLRLMLGANNVSVVFEN